MVSECSEERGESVSTPKWGAESVSYSVMPRERGRRSSAQSRMLFLNYPHRMLIAAIMFQADPDSTMIGENCRWLPVFGPFSCACSKPGK